MRSEFGKRLLLARKTITKLTQQQAAKAVGMSQSNYAELEKNGQGSAFTPALAALFGVNVDWLAYGKGEMLPSAAQEEHTERMRAAAISILGMLRHIPERDLGDAVLDVAEALQRRQRR